MSLATRLRHRLAKMREAVRALGSGIDHCYVPEATPGGEAGLRRLAGLEEADALVQPDLGLAAHAAGRQIRRADDLRYTVARP